MFIMRRRKQATNGIKLPNQEKIKTLWENETGGEHHQAAEMATKTKKSISDARETSSKPNTTAEHLSKG